MLSVTQRFPGFPHRLPTDQASAVAVHEYGRIFEGLGAPPITVESFFLPHGERSRTHVVCAIPRNPVGVVLVESANAHCLPVDAYWLKGLLVRNLIVLYHGNLGHDVFASPLSPDDTEVDSFGKLYDAFKAFQREALGFFLEKHPEFESLAVHEMGVSRGGGFIAFSRGDHFADSPEAPFTITGANGQKQIATTTLVSPAIRLHSNLEWVGRLTANTGIVRGLASLLGERALSWPPVPIGVSPLSREAWRIGLETFRGTRSLVMGSVFADTSARDTRTLGESAMARRGSLKNYPPTFLALSGNGDSWINLEACGLFFGRGVGTSSHGNVSASTHGHMPFWKDPGLIGSIAAFQVERS